MWIFLIFQQIYVLKQIHQCFRYGHLFSLQFWNWKTSRISDPSLICNLEFPSHERCPKFVISIPKTCTYLLKSRVILKENSRSWRLALCSLWLTHIHTATHEAQRLDLQGAVNMVMSLNFCPIFCPSIAKQATSRSDLRQTPKNPCRIQHINPNYYRANFHSFNPTKSHNVNDPV